MLVTGSMGYIGSHLAHTLDLTWILSLKTCDLKVGQDYRDIKDRSFDTSNSSGRVCVRYGNRLIRWMIIVATTQLVLNSFLRNNKIWTFHLHQQQAGPLYGNKHQA